MISCKIFTFALLIDGGQKVIYDSKKDVKRENENVRFYNYIRPPRQGCTGR